MLQRGRINESKGSLSGRSRKADKHVSTPSQLEALLSLRIAERQRQESLEKPSSVFPTPAGETRVEGKKKKKKKKIIKRKTQTLAALISSLKTQRYKNTHSAQPESADEASPPGTLLPRFNSESAAPVSRAVVLQRLRQLLLPTRGAKSHSP